MPSAHFTWLSGRRGLLPFPSRPRSPAALALLLSVSARPSARHLGGCPEAREAIPCRRRAEVCVRASASDSRRRIYAR